jgi:hypothetical protein
MELSDHLHPPAPLISGKQLSAFIKHEPNLVSQLFWNAENKFQTENSTAKPNVHERHSRTISVSGI